MSAARLHYYLIILRGILNLRVSGSSSRPATAETNSNPSIILRFGQGFPGEAYEASEWTWCGLVDLACCELLNAETWSTQPAILLFMPSAEYTI
jgi:hypothetical protein